MNIELLEVIMGAVSMIAILGVLFAKKLNISLPTQITKPLINMVGICGLLSGFFLVMGYIVSPESGIYDRLIYLRGAYVFAVVASCAVIAFLWRMDVVARQHYINNGKE